MDEVLPSGNPELTSYFEKNLPKIKRELLDKASECSQRGLSQTFKWLAEISHSLSKVTPAAAPPESEPWKDRPKDEDVFLMAKSYFDLREYDRCAYFTERCNSPRVAFLHFYSRYLSGEKKSLDNITDFVSTAEKQDLKYLKKLRAEMENLHDKNQLDGFCLYLYGVVLKRLNLTAQARSVLTLAVASEPCHWGAWLELSSLVVDRRDLQGLDLPEHWMKHFFLAHTYLELQLNESALEIYFALQSGMADSTYLLAQIAIAFHNLRQVDQAVEYFQKLSDLDPYRLDNLDTFSNLLYVKEQRVELAALAHRTAAVDKYRTETCCVIGNYYSLRSQHEKAVLYFQRALRLNPNYLSAWTLMGHEFIELKNTNAAIQSYRRAIDVNKRDYRAWYGLGQTYEVLKMPFYCLYYYKKAQELRPNDSRMLVALGESYEKLEQTENAKKCFWKAHCVGDIEGGIALYQLAKLFEKTGESSQAAAAYHQYIRDTEAQGVSDRDQQSRAYRFLAQYFVRSGQLEDAYHFGQKCTEFADTCEEGKAILKEIANRRGQEQRRRLLEGGGGAEESGAQPSGAQPDASLAEDQPRRGDLEPMNLTFTP